MRRRPLAAALAAAALGVSAPVLEGVGVGAGVDSAYGAPIACPGAPAAGKALPARAPRDPIIGALGLDQAWPLSTGSGVTVGVVDTGVSPASPKLAGAVDVGQTYRVTDTKTVFTHVADGRVDCDGHGTAVAGIIAGRTSAGDDRVSGVAPSARIYPVSIQGEIGQAPAPLIAAAIRDAASHAQVINLSFAQTTDSSDIRAAVNFALARGVVVVAATANETGAPASAGTTWYPAAYPGVIAVAAVNADGQVVEGASRGSWISVAAPGEELTSVPRGGSGYVTVTGTSFATALVSGTAALLRARFPTMSVSQVKARLEQTAVPPGDGARDTSVGYGTIDPFAALTDAVPTNETPEPTPSGSVAALPLPTPAPNGDRPLVVSVALGVIALAGLVALGTLSVRVARRRGWHAGALPAPPEQQRVPTPQPAELE